MLLRVRRTSCIRYCTKNPAVANSRGAEYLKKGTQDRVSQTKIRSVEFKERIIGLGEGTT